MARLYLLASAFVLVPAPSVSGQDAPAQPILGTTLTAPMLRELPASGNPFTVFDAMQTEAIGDRFVAAGLNTATPPRTGGLLNSWTQTQVRFGDITITDPRTGGTPLLLPFAPLFSRVSVITGAMTDDDNAPALSMTLEPLAPGASWVREFDGAAAGGFLVSGASSPVAAVDRVEHWGDAGFAVSGPVTARLGLAAAASWRGLSHFENGSVDASTDHVANAFAHVAFAATPADEVHGIAWLQRVTTAAFEDRGLHAQGTWARQPAQGLRWRLFAGYTERKRSVAPVPAIVTVDSLTSDPVSDLFDTGDGTSRTWAIGARLNPFRGPWMPAFGVDLNNARVRVVPSGIGQLRELVDGVPARLWTPIVPASTDFRHLVTTAAFVNTHGTTGPVTIDGGLRVDHAAGGADAAATGVSWTTLLPRARVDWRVTEKMGIAVTGAYRRSAYQMPLNVLAIGDPAAPIADVARWTGSSASSAGPLIARVGPGTSGDASLSRIDQNLRRPVTDEFTLAVRARPFRAFEVELARVGKRESSLLSLTDVGVPFSTYTAFAVPDPSYVAATAGSFDRPFALAFNRPAGTYGRDQYLLTNAIGDPAESWGLEVNMRSTTEHITLLAGIALTWAYGPAAAIGFLPTQNDQNVLGNSFVDANRESYARGQLFQDRSHAGKIAGIYRFSTGLSVGVVARYQDGQPFARLVAVNDGLTQGPTLVRAYRNGGAAFTYTGTLDVRVQRVFPAGRTTVTAGLDIYNLPGMAKEVSEYVVAGPRFREPTALQPPRTATVSVRIAY
jgi:hypothetical protein